MFTVMLPEPELLEIRSEAIPLDVIFEDEDVVVVNKSRGWWCIQHQAIIPVLLLMHCFIIAKIYQG